MLHSETSQLTLTRLVPAGGFFENVAKRKMIAANVGTLNAHKCFVALQRKSLQSTACFFYSFTAAAQLRQTGVSYRIDILSLECSGPIARLHMKTRLKSGFVM